MPMFFMKRPAIFYLEDEVIDKLKEKDNRSAFVNSVLKEALNVANLENLSLEEIDKELALIDLQERHAKELEELKNGK